MKTQKSLYEGTFLLRRRFDDCFAEPDMAELARARIIGELRLESFVIAGTHGDLTNL